MTLSPIPLVPLVPHVPHAPQALLRDCLRDAVRHACRGWLSEHADDIGQATRLRLIHRAASRPAVLTPAYVRRAARHAVIDTIRRRRRRDALWTVHQSAAAPKSGPRDPEAAMLGRELTEVVGEILESLPVARREVVSLYLKGHGISEIAERLGCPRKRVDNLVYRGLTTLRKELTARGLAPSDRSR